MRIAHLADSFRLRAEVHGPTEPAVHLCMAIPNCTYYESLVTSNPVTRESRVGPDGLVHAPTEPGIALPDVVHEVPCRSARLRDVNNRMKGAHMKVKRRWLALASLVAVCGDGGRAGRCLDRRGELRKGLGLDHRLGRRRPPAGGEAVRQDASERALNIVTYDGDGNGATTMQTKIQLWNRTGKGWPDVVFSEQANDPVWMASSRSTSP